MREALLRLVDQGLLQQIPNRGILVPEITISDIIELYDLRKVNDGLAASLFAQQATEEQLIEAQGVLDTAMKAVEEHDFKTWRLCEWQFHDIYIQGIGNGRLKKYLTNLSEQINMVRDESLEPHVLLSRVHDHQAILDAFVARNSDVAEQRAREHWESLKKYWMERYLRLNL